MDASDYKSGLEEWKCASRLEEGPDNPHTQERGVDCNVEITEALAC